MKNLWKLCVKIVFAFLITSNAYAAKDMIINLNVASNDYHEEIYKKYIINAGLSEIIPKSNKNYNFQYHVTLGIIKDIDYAESEELKKYILDNLEKEIKDNNFKVGAASLHGCHHQAIVLLPKNANLFIGYNLKLNEIIKSYKAGKYSMSNYYKNESYLPHMSLKARIPEHVTNIQLHDVMEKLNLNMKDAEIKFEKLEIR